MENAIEVRGLTKKYEGFTLSDVSFTLPSGCIMGFIGENGAGKSTTIRLMLDLARADAGEAILLGEKSFGGSRALREQIGVVMDASGFPDNVTLADVRRIMKNCYKTWNEDAFNRYVTEFELPERKAVKEYSRGMQMKLSIAVALSHDSRLLILDEATSGLDPIVRDEILDIFLRFTRDEDHSVFISSHILSDLEKICDYITFIHQGRIIFSAAKDDLLEKYCVVKCSKEDFCRLNPKAIIGKRENDFGVEALMLAGDVPAAMMRDPATIEDIMLYYVKGR